jgi:hypothetical protein
MANTLPMTLRIYQKLSAAVVPLVPDRRAARDEPGHPAAWTAGVDSRRQRR